MKTSSLLMIAMLAFCVVSLLFTFNGDLFFAFASIVISSVLHIAAIASEREGD
jgi:hypothetical protein